LLAAACAQFPLPIITGIGHERDDTVLDAVAHTRVKTPTAAAAFLINHQMEVVTRLNGWQVQLADLCNRMLHDERLRQERCFLRLTVVQKEWKVQGEYQLQLLRQRLVHALNGRIGEEKHRMSMLQQACTAADPAQLLCRGYSMTFCNGVLVRDATTLKSGDELVTRWAEGETHSVVK
jgi:exodeoxyribonuclease VII large subunit